MSDDYHNAERAPDFTATVSKRLSAKDPAATVILSWDFTNDIATGVGIGGATVSVEVDLRLSTRRLDPLPDRLLAGNPWVVGATVYQSITAGLDGVDYKVKALASTADSPSEVLAKTSVLPVRYQ